MPYIYEDRVSKKDFIDAMTTFCDLSEKEREDLGELGMKHVEKNYSYETFVTQWDKLLTEIHNTHGSWENRKNYKPYEFKEIT